MSVRYPKRAGGYGPEGWSLPCRMEPAMQDKGRHFPFGVVAWYGNNQYLWIGKIHNNMVLIKINIIGGYFPSSIKIYQYA